MQSGAVVAPLARGLVRLRGADARDFLHRMSTQHVEARAPGEAVLNVLTNKQGRTVDVVHHLTFADDDVLLLSAHAEGEQTRAWLDDFLFTEQVELSDETGSGGLAIVAGLSAPAIAGAEGLDPWGMRADGRRVTVRTFDLGAPAQPAFIVWDRDGSTDALVAAITATAVPDLEAARVAAGVPAAPGEVCGRYNPLELELHDAIHWAKGCYIGQEVISRIDNYGKQARQFVGLALADLEGRAPGDEVTLDGKVIGELTSVAPVAVSGAISALAVIKHRGDPVGVDVEVAGTVARVGERAATQTPHD